MNFAKLKEWGRFYLKLMFLAAWRGVICYLYTLTGGALATAGQVVDLRGIGLAGAGWLLLGTVVTAICGALYAHQPADPAEPPPIT